jgi:hypothetical protein
MGNVVIKMENEAIKNRECSNKLKRMQQKQGMQKNI